MATFETFAVRRAYRYNMTDNGSWVSYTAPDFEARFHTITLVDEGRTMAVNMNQVVEIENGYVRAIREIETGREYGFRSDRFSRDTEDNRARYESMIENN